MITQDLTCKCDFCQGETGEFYDDTGNHVGCQDMNARIADLESQNRFLSGVITGMENADNEKLADLQTRLEKAEATVKEYQLVCGGKTPEQTAEFLTDLLLKIMLGNMQLEAMIKEVAEIKKALGAK